MKTNACVFFSKILFICFAIIFISFSAIANEVNIAIASVPTTSPTENESSGNKLVHKLIYEISKAGGLEPKFHFLPFKRTIHMFLNNKTDFLIGFPDFITQFGIKSSEVGFVPIMKVNVLLFYYKPLHLNEIKFKKLSDLDHYLIGAIRGSPLIYKLSKVKNECYALNNLISGFYMLKKNRIDLIASVQLTGQQIIYKHFSKEKENFKMIEKPVESNKFGILTQKSKRAKCLKKLFEKGLNKLRKNGKYEKIFIKYWGEKVPPDTMLE